MQQTRCPVPGHRADVRKPITTLIKGSLEIRVPLRGKNKGSFKGSYHSLNDA